LWLKVRLRRSRHPNDATLRMLEDENRKLKQLLAESMLDNAALKELLSKKW
jgi:putative transposase